MINIKEFCAEITPSALTSEENVLGKNSRNSVFKNIINLQANLKKTLAAVVVFIIY